MSDIVKGFPVRTEEDTDKKVQVKLHDFADPDGIDKQLQVSEKLAHVRVFGEESSNAKRQLKLSEVGKVALDGEYNASTNSYPSSAGLIAHTRGETINSTSQLKRPTAVDGAANSVCLDMALHDELGQPYSSSNPMPVAISESEGAEVENHQTTASLASSSSVNHDYTVTSATTLIGKAITVSASSRVKIEIKLETAAASGVYNTKYVGFTTEANPTYYIDLKSVMKQVADAIVRITITNRDNQAQDVYSTLMAVEV